MNDFGALFLIDSIVSRSSPPYDDRTVVIIFETDIYLSQENVDIEPLKPIPLESGLATKNEQIILLPSFNFFLKHHHQSVFDRSHLHSLQQNKQNYFLLFL